MPIFQSVEQLYTVLDEVFHAVMQHPDNLDSFLRSNLVIRISFAEPEGEILVDGRQPPLEVFYGPRPGKANLEISMSADTLHAIWMNEASTSQSFFNGRIKTRGNLMRAMRIAELFYACEQVYPAIARAHGLA